MMVMPIKTEHRPSTARGVLCAIEGIDGAGKSTTARLVADSVPNVVLISKQTPLMSRNQNMNQYYNQLTSLIFARPKGFGAELSDAHWIRMLAAWFTIHYEELALPHLLAGQDVLLENSPFKYMLRYIANVPEDEPHIRACFEPITREIDATVLLDIDPAAALRRKGGAMSSVEGGRDAQDANDILTYQGRVRLGLHAEARRLGWDILSVDQQTPRNVADRVAASITTSLDRKC